MKPSRMIWILSIPAVVDAVSGYQQWISEFSFLSLEDRILSQAVLYHHSRGQFSRRILDN
jgi:hypothetical protein